MGQRNISKCSTSSVHCFPFYLKLKAEQCVPWHVDDFMSHPFSPTCPTSAATTHYDFILLQSMQNLICLQAFVHSVPLT